MAEAVQLVRAVPVMPVVCRRCGAVLERLCVDADRGWVFYRDRVAPRRRNRRARIRAVASGEGAACGERMTYTCRCGAGVRISWDALEHSALAAQRAGRASLPL